MVTSMLETKCVGDVLGHFDNQHPESFYMSIEHQNSRDVTKIEFQSPTSRYHKHHCRQLNNMRWCFCNTVFRMIELR